MLCICGFVRDLLSPTHRNCNDDDFVWRINRNAYCVQTADELYFPYQILLSNRCVCVTESAANYTTIGQGMCMCVKLTLDENANKHITCSLSFLSSSSSSFFFISPLYIHLYMFMPSNVCFLILFMLHIHSYKKNATHYDFAYLLGFKCLVFGRRPYAHIIIIIVIYRLFVDASVYMWIIAANIMH